MFYRLVATARAAEFATTAASTLFARTGDVYGHGPAIDILAVKRVDGGLRLFGRAHGDKAESARAAAFTVGHQFGFGHGPVRGKRVLENVFGGVEGKVSNIQFTITHYFDVR